MSILDSLLSWRPVSRVRRNHALEHATLHMLAKRNPHRSAAGYSDTGGFWILGELSTDELQGAVDEAYARLQGGERNLGIHPNCGTSFAAVGLVGGSLAWLASLDDRKGVANKLERLPLMFTLVTLAAILAQPLGLQMQARLTVDPDLGKLRVTEIARIQRKNAHIHRIRTTG
jgi:hypothetical protein